MNLDPLSFALAEISYALKNLNKNNFKANASEINQLVNNFGFEADRHLIKCLYNQVDFLDGRNLGKDLYQIHYLNQDYNNFINKPNFTSLICNAIEAILKENKNVNIGQLLTNLSKISKLSRVQEIAYGLSLFHSTNPELKEYTKAFLKQKVPEFLQSYIEGSSHHDGLHDIAVEILHLLLTNLLNGQEDQFGIGAEQIEAFLAALRKDFPPDRVPVALAPLIYQKVIEAGSTTTTQQPRDPLPVHKLRAEIPAITKTMVDVSKLVMELGYAFCSGPPEDCQSHLIQIGVHEITPASVARILGMMASSHTDLSDGIPLYTYTAGGETSWNDSKDKSDSVTTWNTEVFVNAVKEVVPHFHWRDVVYELDQAGLVIKDKQGLKLIMQAIFQGLESNTETFPVDFFYRSWNHSEEQLSWLESIVNNPDVFCFADYPSKQVSTDILKLSPEDESDRKIHTWKSLDMIEALLKLSERGHYQRVQELFKFPLQNCRDILTLGLLQIKGPLTLLGQDLLATLLPHALANNSNSLIVLQIAWHSQYHSNITRTLIMHSMAEWYMKDPNDQSRLSRILDIAQDLKALSLLLNCTPFGFIVDLACLASRREYLKLEKWLGEKIREHRETFIWALIAFMRRRCPQVVHLLASGSSPFNTSTTGNNNSGKEDRFLGAAGLGSTPPAPIPKSLQLPPEIMNVIVNSLQTFVASMLQPPQAVGLSGPGQQGQPLTAHPLLKANSMYPGSSSTAAYRSGQAANQPGPQALSPELCDTLGTLLVGLAPSRTQKHQLAAILQQQQQQQLQQQHQNASMLIGGPGLNNSVIGNNNAPLHHSQRLLGTTHLPLAATALNQQPRHHLSPYEPPSGFGPGLYDQTQNQRSSLLNPLAQLLPPDLPSGLDYQTGLKQQAPSGAVPQLQQPQGPLSTSVSSVSALLDLLTNMGVGTGIPNSELNPKPPSAPAPNTGGQQGSANIASNNNLDMATVFPSFDALARAMGHNVVNAGAMETMLMGNNKSTPQQNINTSSQITQSAPTSSSAQANMLSVDLSAMFPDMNMSSFGKDIEDEANAYFQRIYNRPPHPTMCLDDFLAMLKRFRDSPEQREREVFACMLRNLFEEYRFFSTYPEKELHITSCLFGGLVEKGICNYVGLSIALRFVLEALRKPKEDKMRFFGTTALDTFKELLKDYTQYCSHITQIPHFFEFPPYLREYVECGARGQEVPLANKVSAPNPSKSFTPPPQNTQTSTANASITTTPAILQQPANPGSAPTPSVKSTAFDADGQAANAEPKEEILVPSEMVQDKLAFIFNNLSQANINQKTEEVMELMVDENLPWVSRYLVMKRASIENNFHNLYANFLDCIRIPRLNNLVIQETFRNIKILMKSDKAAGNFSDRSLLKNLGHWLGLLTIAKSKPLLQLEIDVKQLILEAAVKGTQELLYGIPFVAKILESCSKSKVFKPPNPWTMAIMNLLAEIHKEPEMKLNLKFEIEMLCKTLNLDINSLGRETDILASYRNKLAAAAASAAEQQASTLPGGVPQDTGTHPSAPVTLPPAPRLGAPPPQTPAPTAAAAAAAAAASFFNMIMMQQAQAQNDAAAAQQQQQLLATLLSNLGGGGGATPAPFQQQLQQMLGAATAAAAPQQPQSAAPPTPQNLVGLAKKGPPGSGYNSASSTPHPPSGLLSNTSSVVQPQFHYNDINVSSGFAGILPYIQINSQIPLFQLRPQLRQLVRLALERSIQEILPPLAERVLKITLASAESLIKKDFALDPEEGRMRAAAHHLVRFLAGGISLYTVREPLFASLLTNFKSAFTIGLRGTTSLSNPSGGASSSSTPLNPFEPEAGNNNPEKLSANNNAFITGPAVDNKDIKELMHLVEHAANCLAGDNFELACCFAQKTTIERAVVEIDRRLGPAEYEIRKLARVEHRRYCDPLVLTYQAERLPEQIRLKVGGVTPSQAMVYEVFSRNIPGFVPNSAPRDLSLGAFGNLGSLPPPPPNFYPKLHPGPGGGVNNLAGPARALFDSLQPPLGVAQSNAAGLLTGDDLQARILDKLASELEQGLISLGSATASLAGQLTLNENTAARPEEADSPHDNNADGSGNQNAAPTPNQQLAPLLRSLLETSILVRNVASVNGPEPSATVAQSLVNKCMDGLFESCYLNQQASAPEIHDLASKFRDAYILVLKAIQDPRTFGPQWANKHVTKYLIETKEESRFNFEAIGSLITNRLINIQQYDTHLSHSMENGLNYVAVTFGMQLVKRFCLDERDSFPLSESDFYKTIDALTSVSAHSRQAPPDLASLMERIKNETDINLLDRGPVLYSAMFHSGISAAKEFDDPPGLQDKVEFLFREWLNIYNSPSLSKDLHAAINSFMMQMHQQGIFKTDDLITRFFRICTEVCVESCYRTLQSGSSDLPLTLGTTGSVDNNNPLLIEENKARAEGRRFKCYQNVDAYVKLIALLIKHSNQSENNGTQVNLLNKVLGIFVGLLVQHHKNPPTGNVFMPLPFHRLFAILYSEIIGMSSMFDSHAVQIVTAFCNAYHVLRPIELPGFCFSWLELIAHRNFLAKTLAYAPQSKVWNHYSELLTDIFKFLAPYLRNVDLPKSLLHFYNGCLRLLLVLLHDFPEFLCDFHYGFCDVIPPNCVQMRNLVLSAFPRNMRLPDPFTPNLKVDLLPEITHSPRVTTNFGAVLTAMAPEFKQCMDTYLKTRSPVTFLTDIRSNLQENPSPGSHYNISLVNALVLYVGTQAISSIQSQGLTPGLTTITHSSHMDVFQNLAVGLDSEGRYLFLNAIANQLRYPNSHTHYFSCILLHLFGEANTEAIQEQITRVLLERLIVNRPHPWGLLITFIELIKNASFNFWDHDFVRCAPEIEKLFDSVSKSCMQAKPQILIQSRENQAVGRLSCDGVTGAMPSNNELGGTAASGINISMTNLSL